MTGIELRTYGVRSDRSTNCATTTSHVVYLTTNVDNKNLNPFQTGMNTCFAIVDGTVLRMCRTHNSDYSAVQVEFRTVVKWPSLPTNFQRIFVPR